MGAVRKMGFTPKLDRREEQLADQPELVAS
jgi:hypothetical protein